jgi:RNA recognition motif-containing protein
MDNKLYVGNLSYSTSETGLQSLFGQAGTVTSVQVIKDRETGRSKGFGFVEMSSEEEAQKAINMFNGKQLDGRELKVNIARPREDRPAGGGDDRRRSYSNDYNRKPKSNRGNY